MSSCCPTPVPCVQKRRSTELLPDLLPKVSLHKDDCSCRQVRQLLCHAGAITPELKRLLFGGHSGEVVYSVEQ